MGNLKMTYLRVATFMSIAAILIGCSMQTVAVEHKDRLSRSVLLRSTHEGDESNLKIYVANRASNSVTVYPDAAIGNAKPTFHVSGHRTLLFAPSSLGFDAAQRLYVLNYKSIVVFAAGARGNVAPQLVIRGSATELSNPQAMAVDPTGKVFVTNDPSSGRNITAYAAGSDGNRAPVQEILDRASLFFIPLGIALHGGLLYVADQGDQTINEYSDKANGPTTPVAVISGLVEPSGVAVDAQGRIYVTEGSSAGSAIVVYAANANGNAKPLQTISGSQTLLNEAAGLTVHNSEIVVANYGNDSITVYPQNGNGDIPPLRQVFGTNTGLQGPQGLFVH